MPNIKSSEKRAQIGKVRNARNKADKSALKTTLKKFDAAAAGGDQAAAAASHKIAVKSVDRAVSKGLIHKNNAAHKKSKMAKKMNGLG
ncbi:MAG: 30S ribosomal protein S20 [Firmicutes bacterium]|nr:30S ribosomal protein S20 [Bacillota bacterium]